MGKDLPLAECALLFQGKLGLRETQNRGKERYEGLPKKPLSATLILDNCLFRPGASSKCTKAGSFSAKTLCNLPSLLFAQLVV